MARLCIDQLVVFYCRSHYSSRSVRKAKTDSFPLQISLTESLEAEAYFGVICPFPHFQQELSLSLRFGELEDPRIAILPVTAKPAPAIFYPFGSTAGDKSNPVDDDGSSSVIQLSSPFLFFGRTYQQIYVNNNGHLTFDKPSSLYTPYSFPANRSQDIIAGLWTNLNNNVRGVISYQQYTNGNVLTRASQDINTHFPNLTSNASWVFVATWDKVAYFNLSSTETSFQVVLISDGNFSFILMNYGDIAVTEHPVQAGYDTVNSTDYFVIPGSNNGSIISNLRNSSNVNVTGRWVFRVDGGQHNISKETATTNSTVIGFRVRLKSFLDLTNSTNTNTVLQQIKQELVKYGLSNSIELKLRKVQKINP
ncbi:sushi, nidogen and EGF-like domain-containing protein 1 [Carassius auratus]|uniref:Sushi, nidogen and EGF-like domain-containing protein 1 n=1 Tax=Carassius auratus TaxID=7957 RepID=A0A6P6NF21_CARAU|nr:sushi, nidogen and EGF-like domain-containing protein 1 [Carassius auratus]